MKDIADTFDTRFINMLQRHTYNFRNGRKETCRSICEDIIRRSTSSSLGPRNLETENLEADGSGGNLGHSLSSKKVHADLVSLARLNDLTRHKTQRCVCSMLEKLVAVITADRIFPV